MAWRNNTLVYGSIAKCLHWLLAILIIGLIAIGLTVDGMDPSIEKLKLLGMHKAFGITALLLVSIRLLWKLSTISPLPISSIPQWQQKAAYVGHTLLYCFMVAMPISGWLMSSAAGYPVSVFGVVTLPLLLDPDPMLRSFFQTVHESMAWGLIVMIGIHILAALQHHFYYKDNTLRRMLPYGKLKHDKAYTKNDTMAGC